LIEKDNLVVTLVQEEVGEGGMTEQVVVCRSARTVGCADYESRVLVEATKQELTHIFAPLSLSAISGKRAPTKAFGRYTTLGCCCWPLCCAAPTSASCGSPLLHLELFLAVREENVPSEPGVGGSSQLLFVDYWSGLTCNKNSPFLCETETWETGAVIGQKAFTKDSEPHEH